MRILVIIPTYNERGNLEHLVEEIFMQKVEGLSVMIVDDNSPDGTGILADNLAKIYPMKVFHRSEKEGLGVAYRDAISFVMSEPVSQRPSLIFEMDADFSHSPNDIPRLLAQITNADVVLGSRYIKGGGVENWNFFRRVVSRLGNLYAQAVLGLPYSDLTGGYKLFRMEVLEQIDIPSLSSTGYNFQIETTYRAHKKGFRIKEVPIIFSERTIGKSKFNLVIIIESFLKVVILRLHKL